MSNTAEMSDDWPGTWTVEVDCISDDAETVTYERVGLETDENTGLLEVYRTGAPFDLIGGDVLSPAREVATVRVVAQYQLFGFPDFVGGEHGGNEVDLFARSVDGGSEFRLHVRQALTHAQEMEARAALDRFLGDAG